MKHELYFNYKNKSYSIFFYPCGNLAKVTLYQNNKEHSREIKYNNSLTVVSFLEKLEKLDFYF